MEHYNDTANSVAAPYSDPFPDEPERGRMIGSMYVDIQRGGCLNSQAHAQGRQRRGDGDAYPQHFSRGMQCLSSPLLRRTCVSHHNVTFN